MARIANGGEVAFAELYDDLAPTLYGTVLRIVRDPAQSEEVTQEVFVELWRQAARFDAPAAACMPGRSRLLVDGRWIACVPSSQQVDLKVSYVTDHIDAGVGGGIGVFVDDTRLTVGGTRAMGSRPTALRGPPRVLPTAARRASTATSPSRPS